MKTRIACIVSVLFLITSLLPAQVNKPFKLPKFAQKVLADMILIPTGSFNMGRTLYFTAREKDTTLLTSSRIRTVSLQNFYISDHEVTNNEYRQFVNWAKDSKNDSLYKAIYPDTACWTNDFPYFANEPLATYYYKHPAYDNYPVVGVSWIQATAYCKWRTEQLNASIAKDLGLKEFYYTEFRLPTEAEWEYAALSIATDKANKTYIDKNYFPWAGQNVINKKGKYLANLGPIWDQNGFLLKSYLDDENVYTAAVRSYLPNGYLLYDMAGNVAEWVMDGPHAGDFYVNVPDSLLNSLKVNDNDDINVAMKKVIQIKLYYGDGTDTITEQGKEKLMEETMSYIHNAKVLHINPNGKIVKGGSWANGPAYLLCGARTVFSENKSSSMIGFRLAMSYNPALNGKQ